ncbi:MAG: hypothetical protein NTX57_11010 [Armatimonadetes bacterium]|nr:hypothetical protein [Armatimonadota bacterium]
MAHPPADFQTQAPQAAQLTADQKNTMPYRETVLSFRPLVAEAVGRVHAQGHPV